MALANSLRANGPLKGLKIPVGGIPHHRGAQWTARQFSTIFQGTRPTHSRGPFITSTGQRSHLSTTPSLPGTPSSSAIPVAGASQVSSELGAPAPTNSSAVDAATPQLSAEQVTQSGLLVQAPPSSGLTDAATSIPEPLQFGDLADLGLGALWTPAGLVERVMEVINVTTGLPWFYTIIVGTVVVRLSTFYFAVQQTRMTARVKRAPQIEIAKAKLEEAKESRDSFKVGMAGQEMQKAYKDAGVSMGKMVLFPLVQLPPAIGLFLGVKKLCTLPVEQLTHSGFSLVPDLTLISGTAAFDPYYILPLIGCAALNAQLKLSMRDLGPEQTTAPHVMNAVRCLSPLILYFSAFFPAGLLVSISTGIGFSVAQAAFFRSKAVRKALELPFVPQATVKPPTVMESITYGATQAQERGWAKKIMSMFKIPGLSEAVPTAAAAEGKVSKAKATRAPRGDFMERPKSRH